MKQVRLILGIVALIVITLAGCRHEELGERIPISEIPDMEFGNYLLIHYDTNNEELNYI